MKRIPTETLAKSTLAAPYRELALLIAKMVRPETLTPPPAWFVGPVGSRGDTFYVIQMDGITYARAGCFMGTLPEFKAELFRKYPRKSVYGAQYRLVVAMAEAWAEETERRMHPFGEEDVGEMVIYG